MTWRSEGGAAPAGQAGSAVYKIRDGKDRAQVMLLRDLKRFPQNFT